MKDKVMGRANGGGLTMGELRRFVEGATQYPDDAWLDCFVPSTIEAGTVSISALMGIEVEENVDCPRCGKALQGDSVMHAISRIAPGVHICNSCGGDEAMWDMTKPHQDMPPITEMCR